MVWCVLLALLPQKTRTSEEKDADKSTVTNQDGKDLTVTTKNSTPTPGWWAVQHNIGNDRRLALIPEEHVLSSLGLWLATTGWCIAFETEYITEAELMRHAVVGAASTETVLAATRALLEAGIWTDVPGVGIDCGAADHIQAKAERIERARRGGEAKAAKGKPGGSEYEAGTEL